MTNEVEVDPDRLADEIELRRQWYAIIRAMVYFAGTTLLLLACWPLARELAGRDTGVNVTVSLSLTMAVTVASGCLALALRKSRKQNKELRRRNRRLGRKVKDLRQQLAGLGGDSDGD